MKLPAILRLIRIRLSLGAVLLALILCIKTGKTTLETVLITLLTFFSFAHVISISEIVDEKVDRKKYEKFGFYRSLVNPIVSGEITKIEAKKVSLFFFIVSCVLSFMLITFYPLEKVYLAILAYVLILIYVLLDRGIIGNICFSLTYPLLFTFLERNLLIYGIIFAIYNFAHNINNQIEDYEVEKDIYKTVPVQIGIKCTKILGVVLIIVGILLCVKYFIYFVIPFLTLLPLFFTENEKIMDYIRAINYALVLIPFILL